MCGRRTARRTTTAKRHSFTNQARPPQLLPTTATFTALSTATHPMARTLALLVSAALAAVVTAHRGGSTVHGPGVVPRHDGNIRLTASAADLHARAAWHNQQNQHEYPVHPYPASLPLAQFVSPLNSQAANSRRRVAEQALLAGAAGHMRGGRGLQTTPGSSTSTACGVLPTNCAIPSATTSSARTTVSLTYSTTTGVFTGYIVTSQCPAWPADFQYNGTLVTHPVPSSCIQQNFPAEVYNPPAALSIAGRIGLAIRSGENLYGGLEQGFALGFACTNSLGTCTKGADVSTCAAQLEYE